jgi:hypothetical protein
MKNNTIVFILFWTALIFLGLFSPPHPSYASYQELGKTELLGPIGDNNSQYSPWVMHNPGWSSYVMYYCKSVPRVVDGNNFWQDRVWRIENLNDGKSGNWVNDQPVIQGTVGQNDEESCSPGVLIDNQNTWHMYYVTSARDTGCNVYLYHAIADAPGVTWTKKGVININGAPMAAVPSCAVETPSTYFINGKYVVYYSSPPGKLVRIESTDGHNFTNQTTINLSDPSANAGRLIMVNGQYYYVYGRNPTNPYLPPTQILITQSSDGVNFSTPELLMASSGSGWDGDKMWHPSAMVINNELRVYYAGNIGNYGWWGFNSSIGVRWFSPPTPPPSPPPPTPPPPTVPNCYNVDGPASLVLGQPGTYSADVYSPGSALSGELNWFDGTIHRILYWDFTPPYAIISTSWNPPAAGTYSVCCRAWNDAIAECRPASFGGIGGVVSACAGPNTCKTVVVTTPAPTTPPTPPPSPPPPTPTIPTPTAIPKPGDLNGDGKVDIYDYNILVADFGKTGTPGWIPADIIKDGKVDIYDYNVLVGNFGK